MSKRVLISLFLATALSGCLVSPEPFDALTVASFAEDKLERVTADQEPIHGRITLYEAMARALKYNLDYKVEVMEKALRIRKLDLAHFKLLPSLVANTGYAGRDNFSGGNSREILGKRRLGNESLQSSTSQEREIHTADLTFSWNILDFGLSYVRARQAADEVLIANELKRKVINRVVEDVRTAYWRALSSQRLIWKLRKLERRVRSALANTRRLASENDTSPITALTYERELVEIKREIQRLHGELMVAKTQLAALMNVRPDSKFSLAAPSRPRSLRVRMPVENMIATAISNRPELREVMHRMRINEREADAAIFELLPGLQTYAGVNYDSNSFLFNSHWISWGAKASWNLLKIFQYPARRNLIQSQNDLLEQRALALTMAVMTQVHVSRARYLHYRKELNTAREYLNVQRRLLEQMRASAQAGRASEQTLIREEMNTLVAQVKYDIAYANLQNGFANLFASMGLDPHPPGFDSEGSVREISTSLRRLWFERGDYDGHLSKYKRKRKPQHVASKGKPEKTVKVVAKKPAEPDGTRSRRNLAALLFDKPAKAAQKQPAGLSNVQPKPNLAALLFD